MSVFVCVRAEESGRSAWIRADRPTVDVQADIARLAGVEGWSIVDFEGFGPLDVSGENLDRVCALARAIAVHGRAYACWVDAGFDSDCFESSFVGSSSSAHEIADWLGIYEEVPDWLQHYVDAEAILRDMDANGDLIVLEDGEVRHVFWAE